MGVQQFLCHSVRRHHNLKIIYKYAKGLAGTFLSIPNISSSSRLASGTGLTPEELTKLINHPRSAEKNVSTKNFTKQPKLSSAKEHNLSSATRHVNHRHTSIQQYVSEIVLGNYGDDERDVHASKVQDARNRNRYQPFPRTNQNSSKQMKQTRGTFDDEGISGTEFDDEGYHASNVVSERKSKRGLFMENSSEYNTTSVLKVIQFRIKSYQPDKDDVKAKLLVDSIINNQTMSEDVVSEGIQSFCRLPSDKLHENAGVELTLHFANVICKWASTFDIDSFCSALLMCVRLHCMLTPEELRTLHNECLHRLRSLDLHSMLLISDCWLCLNQFKLTYHQKMISTAASDLFYGTELTSQNVTQIFYIMGLLGRINPPKRGVVLKLLQTIENSLGELTWLEISIICFALIKTSAPNPELPSGFLTSLNKKLVSGLKDDQIDMFSVMQIMRLLSRCYNYDVDTFDALAATLTPVIHDNLDLTPDFESKYKGMRVAHIATSFAKVKMFHPPLMDAIIERVLQEDRTVTRTKDVHLLLWAFGRLNYKPAHADEFIQHLMHVMQHKTQRMMYPEIFLRSLVSLTFLDYYPDFLIHEAFSPAFLRICDEHIGKNGVNPICKQLFNLDCSVAVECPSYDGNRLPERYIKMYEDVHHGSVYYTTKLTKSGSIADIIRLLGKMFGNKEYIKFHAILPHIKTPVDIEVHLDFQGNPVFPESFHTDHTLGPNLGNVAIPYYKLNQLVKETVEESNPGKTQRLAILVTEPKHCLSNSPKLLGVHVMKRRQLRKVGYKIIEISQVEWDKLCTTDERELYLKNKLANPS